MIRAKRTLVERYGHWILELHTCSVSLPGDSLDNARVPLLRLACCAGQLPSAGRLHLQRLKLFVALLTVQRGELNCQISIQPEELG